MNHAQSQLFYRCYSNRSAGKLRSGRYPDVRPALSKVRLLEEFDNHQIRENRQPTALVSVTNRLLEAVNRALSKYDSGEAEGTIWIVIIRVSGGQNNNSPHHARDLARQRDYKNADVFKNEYLFEWEVPWEYVEHLVSVETLLDRGIWQLLDLQTCFKGFPSFGDMQNTLVKSILKSDPYSTGRWLGSLSQAFGVTTCTYELAHEILRTCLSGGYIDEDLQFIRFCRPEFCGSLDFSAIYLFEPGIDDELDWCFGT